MTPDAPDDDRTVIRPLGPAGADRIAPGAAPRPADATAMPGKAAAADAPADLGAAAEPLAADPPSADPPADDRTLIRPAAAAAAAGPAADDPADHDGGKPAAGDAPADDDRTLIKPPPPAAAVPAPAPAPEETGNGLAVGTRLGEFELTQYVAEGGFGIVYLAYDHSLQRRVALKEYMPSSLAARGNGSQVSVKSERHRETFEAGRKSFINEARLLASFDHPSLLKVYRFWEANGTAYMVMPFLEGITLKDRLRELGQPPDEAWLRAMLGPLTEALMVIHREQCYHRDIAPDNIMLLAESNRALLMDFGASRRVIGDMTQALTVILKPGYAPVEQYAEIPGMKQGPWTDVYALAAVVYYAILGKTPPTSVGRLLNDTYVPLAQAAAGRYSAGFLAAIDHALAVKPEQRTASIEALRAELGLGGASQPESTVAMTAPRASATAAGAGAAPRRNTALIAGAGVVLVAALGIGGYLLLGPAPAPPVATAVPAAASPAPTPAVAAGPTAPVAAAPQPAAAFDIAEEFDRVTLAQTPGFTVQAQANKSQLRIDHDELSFTVQSSRDGFLYVQSYGSDGSLLLLYPNATGGTVKVRAGQTLKLPQPPVVFLTTEPVGPTRLLVMVSALERDFSSLQPRKDGPYRMLPTGEQARRIAAAQPPSRVPLQAGRVICPASGDCADEFGATVIRVDAVR